MPDKRSANETRDEILRVAIDLFTANGFEATSVRDIADAVGLTQSSLYYHFTNKDAIVASLLSDRVAEVESLAEWISQQPRGPGLVRATALKWIDRTTPERLMGMRLAQANQPVLMRLVGSSGDIGAAFERVLKQLLSPGSTAADDLYLRVVFNTVNATLLSSRGSTASNEDVLEVARRVAIALT